jgi:hypothetical protein
MVAPPGALPPNPEFMTALANEFARLAAVRNPAFGANRLNTPQTAAAALVETLPDLFISEPLLGHCYSTVALARWRGVTRQGIVRQHKVGALFAVMHKGRLAYPACQFDRYGRRSKEFDELFARVEGGERDPLEFAIWLHQPDVITGVAPATMLEGDLTALIPNALADSVESNAG